MLVFMPFFPQRCLGQNTECAACANELRVWFPRNAKVEATGTRAVRVRVLKPFYHSWKEILAFQMNLLQKKNILLLLDLCIYTHSTKSTKIPSRTLAWPFPLCLLWFNGLFVGSAIVLFSLPWPWLQRAHLNNLICDALLHNHILPSLSSFSLMLQLPVGKFPPVSICQLAKVLLH